MIMSNSQLQIILGSQSPRRRELMAGLGLPFTSVSIDADESYPENLKAEEIPIYISRVKAHAYEPKLLPSQLLITADTIVWCNNKMLGKPHDEEEACEMLRQLSGRTHHVFTAVTFLMQGHPMETIVDATKVTFRTLTEEEILHYVKEYRPLDKAGAYGVQEWIGYAACTHLNGSYFNVMGFPTHLVYEQLQKFTALVQ